MTHPAQESSVQIASIHQAAICKEIGERLRTCLDLPVSLPPRLLGLMEQLRDDRPRNSADPGA
jgi:hypothetical protein